MVNRDSVQRLLAGDCEQRARRLGEEFQERARARCSRRSGALADSITVDDPIVAYDKVTGRVHTESDYAEYQDEGTGIFGPRGERIVPTDAQALRFDWPAAGGVVFFASVAGTEPTRFWTLTIAEWPDIVRSA